MTGEESKKSDGKEIDWIDHEKAMVYQRFMDERRAQFLRDNPEVLATISRILTKVMENEKKGI